MICWCLWCLILYSRAPLPKANRAEFVYQHVHALDMETYNILTKLPECLEFIKLGRSEGAILVHWLVSASDYRRPLLSHSWLSSFVFLSTFHWLLIIGGYSATKGGQEARRWCWPTSCKLWLWRCKTLYPCSRVRDLLYSKWGSRTLCLASCLWKVFTFSVALCWV